MLNLTQGQSKLPAKEFEQDDFLAWYPDKKRKHKSIHLKIFADRTSLPENLMIKLILISACLRNPRSRVQRP